jgi:uncharacterized protein (DUF2249 family)
MRRIEMDLRGLQPPEPMMRIIDALGDDEIEATFPHQPVPLYAMLEERGYQHEVVREDPGLCIVRIRKRI